MCLEEISEILFDKACILHYVQEQLVRAWLQRVTQRRSAQLAISHVALGGVCSQWRAAMVFETVTTAQMSGAVPVSHMIWSCDQHPGVF